MFVPVDGVLVELAELPVDGEDVHVVVLLEVVSQQVQRVLAGLQPLLVLVDLLHLKNIRHTMLPNSTDTDTESDEAASQFTLFVREVEDQSCGGSRMCLCGIQVCFSQINIFLSLNE